jgi:hypothetical protein
MCVLIQATRSDGPKWRPEDVAIDVPVNLTPEQAMQVVRGILAELGVGQPSESTMEATCFCGARIPAGSLANFPKQVTPSFVEASHGA